MRRHTPLEWKNILVSCGVKVTTAGVWAPIFSEVIEYDTFNLGDSETDDFLGQVLHESSMLERLEEGLNYRTPGRLMTVWPTRFKSLEDEKPYLGNPQKLAEFVYGGRMGNTQPGDGWRNRGSGLLQVTGADNLRQVQRITGIPVYDNPELLRRPSAENLRVCIAWWEKNIPDNVIGNARRVTRLVNGGEVGLQHREQVSALARQALEENPGASA